MSQASRDDHLNPTGRHNRHHAVPQTPYTSLVHVEAISSMARPEVLDRIKAAETEADEIIAEAEADADERLAEARARADEIRAEAEEAAAAEAETRLEDAREEIEAASEEILAEGRADREALESTARERLDDAVGYTVDQFEAAVMAHATEE